MTTKTKTAFLAALTVLVVFGCKQKEAAPDPLFQQRISWLVDSTPWTLRYAGIDFNKDGVIDHDLASGGLPYCQLDNSYDFSAGGIGNVFDSTAHCDTSGVVNRPFSWAFTDNQQSIDISGTEIFGLTGHFKIYELTDSRFSIARDTLVTLPFVPQMVTGWVIMSLKH
jgi:hypothetical protein